MLVELYLVVVSGSETNSEVTSVACEDAKENALTDIDGPLGFRVDTQIE